ncbi:LysM peptidoglycan-binding domain-containing protein [Candidatus Pacearchaeota archaeon]|nr:LysM peptidoglycan-binding domain-containing protein [Candidatus Pacearchaeota archaeon]
MRFKNLAYGALVGLTWLGSGCGNNSLKLEETEKISRQLRINDMHQYLMAASNVDYVVQSGDNLYKIALDHLPGFDKEFAMGEGVQRIANLNSRQTHAGIEVGKHLKVPYAEYRK